MQGQGIAIYSDENNERRRIEGDGIMTEKFFIVTEASPLHKDYFHWLENKKVVQKFACDFAKEHGLPTLISYNNDSFAVVLERKKHYPFMIQLKKNPTWTEKGELYEFKKSSVIGKAWIEELKASDLKVESRPLVLMYFSNCMGRWGWELFQYGEKLYLKTSSESEPNTPDGMTEIKGSEYYAAIEAYDAEREVKR